MAKATKKKSIPPTPPTIKRKKPSVGKPRQDRGFDVDFDPAEQLSRIHQAAPIPKALQARASPDVLNRLWTIIDSRRRADAEVSHSARLLARGKQRVAQKLGEEAVECLLELTAGNRGGLISESADLLYHLLVAWVCANVKPDEVWYELERREKVSQVSEGNGVPLKRLLGSVQIGTTKIP